MKQIFRQLTQRDQLAAMNNEPCQARDWLDWHHAIELLALHEPGRYGDTSRYL